MKSVSVKGSFHQQLCSTNKRQPSERTSIKRPLLFKGNNSSRYVPTSSGFSSLLSGVDRENLGPVDPHWFEKAASNDEDCGKDLQCEEPQEEILQGVAHQSFKSFSDIGETPTRHRKASDEVDHGTPDHFHSPPSLFTPDERHHGIQRQCDERQYFTRTSHHPVKDDISPATPSLVPITPNLPVEESNAMRQTQSLLGASPFSVEQSAQQDPSPCWNSTHKQTTPTFMKQLFKTPSSLMKLDDFSFTTPGHYLSTPVRMSVSLGADLNDSNLSWTSSLATPQGATDTKMTNMSLLHKDWNEESTVVAKALFTSCIETPNCHTPSRGRIDQDSQASTVHLHSLHMSSAEEDALGDTLGSEVADDEEAGKVGKVDGDVQRGITRCGDKEEEGQSHSDCMSEPEEQNEESISIKVQSRTEGRKQNLKKTFNILVQATAVEDNDNAGTVQISSSAILSQHLYNLPTDNLSESRTKFTLDQPKQSSHTVQTCSQQSTADLLDNSSSPNDSALSGVEKSRLDDTLAFFFLTPPQTRSRIANLKKQKLMKEIEERIQKQCLSEFGDSTSKIQEAAPLENCCLPESQSAIAVRESSQELSEKETRATHGRNTVVRIKEEDGSLKEVIEDLSETQISQASFKNTNLDDEGICSNFPHEVSDENAKMTLDDSVNLFRGELIVTENLNASSELELHSDSINNLPNISAQPNVFPTSIKDLQLTDTCKPATISIDANNVTPLKRTRKLDTAPNIDSPDIFSQISPNFVNALCNLTDQVSESNHPRKVSSPVHKPPEQTSMNQGNSPFCTTKPDSCILPSVSIKSSLSESMPQPSVLNLTLDKETLVRDLKPKTKYSENGLSIKEDIENGLSIKEKDSENGLNIKEKDTQSQLFRMQPKAATTRRFFYPPGSSNVGQAGVRKAMQWMSEAVLVKSDEDKQEISEPGPITDKEKATDETTHRNSSHSYSSTPTMRNSGFVTFNNFINSKRAQAPSFMYPSKVTVLHHKNMQCQDKLIHQGQVKHQATDRSNVNGQSGSSNTTSQTTPLSRRGSLPHNSSYSRVRRRADTHGLPAPKRLKTTLDSEQPGYSIRHSDGKGSLIMKEPLEKIPENEMAPCTKLSGNCTSVEQTSHLGSISDENVFNLKGATSSVDSDGQKLPKNFALSKDIQRQNEEQDVKKTMQFSSMTNKLAFDEYAKFVHQRNPSTVSSKIQNPTIPATVGFSSASGNAIHISESALHKARALFDEDNEKQRSAIIVAKDSLKLAPNKQKTYSESENDVGSNTIPVNVGITSASGKSIHISESALNKAKTLFTEEDPRYPISSSDSASTSRETVPKTLGFSSASGKAIHISESALNKAKTLFTEEDPRYLTSSSDSASTSRETVPQTLGFSSASGKAIHISESALNKAKTLFTEDDPRYLTSSSDSASTSRETVPQTLGFSSASGKAFHISESALNKAKTLFTEEDPRYPTSSSDSASTSRGTVPQTLGFSSASGKAIHISELALNKAKTLFTEEDPRDPISSLGSTSTTSRGAVPKILGFSSASGKAIHISELALNKAKTLFTEEDPRDPISSLGSTSTTSRGAVPKILGFSSASGKAIQISESALQKAKLFLEDDQEPSSQFASRSGKNIPQSKSSMMKSTMLNKENDKKLLTAQNNVIREHDLNSEIAELKTTAFAGEKVSSKVGFASASGKPIPVSKTALQRAKQLFEKDENEIPTTVAFASASGKSIEISDVGLKKARAMFEESGDILPASSKRSCPETLTSPNELSRPSKPSRFGQEDSRPETNTRNLPKGFRPFKAPAKMKTPAKPETPLKRSYCLPKTCEVIKDKIVPSICSSLNLESIPEAQEIDFTSKGPGSVEMVRTQNLEFEEDFLTASQAQREIEAVEQMESAYAFMQAEDESFSQFEDLSVGKFITGMGPGRSLKETAMNQECSKPPASQVSDDKEPVHDLLSTMQCLSSQTLSQASDSLNQAFVQSQLSTGDVTEVQETIPTSFSQQKDSKREINKILPKSDISLSVVDEMEIPGSNTLSPLNAEKPTFIGFQTANGYKVEIPQDALRKAKAFLDANSQYEESCAIKAGQQANTHPTDQTQGHGGPRHKGSHFSGFQTAGGRRVEISKEALKKAKNLFSEEEIIHSPHSPQNCPPARSCNSINQDVIAPEGVGMTKALSTFSVGFQTASGNKVSISEESLKRARHVLEGDDECFRKGQQLSNIASTARGGSHQQSKVKTASCGRKTNSQGSIPIGDKLSVGSLEFASPIPRGCVGFQTASGNKVTVSAEALSKAHKFLKADEDEMIPRIDEVSVCRQKSWKGERSRQVPVGCPKSALKASAGFQTASGNVVTVSANSLAKAKQFLASTEEANTNSHTRSSQAIASQEDDSVPEGAVRTSNKAPAPYVGFQAAGGNKATISAESLAQAQRVLVEGGSNLPAVQQTGGTRQSSSLNEEEMHLGPSHSSQYVPPISVGFQTASGNKVTISAESLAKAQRFLANSDHEPKMVQGTSVSKAIASQKGESLCTGLAQTSNQSRKPFDGFRTASGDKVSISAESLANAQRFLADDDRSLSHPTSMEPCLGFSTANGNKVSVSADALASAQRFLADDNETVTAPRTTQPCVGFSTASGNKVSVSADALATAQRFLADGDKTVTSPRTTQPCLGFSTASGNKVSVSEAALKKAQSFLQDDDNTNHVFHHDISSAKNQRTSNQASRPPIPLGFQTAGGSSVSVSRTSLQQVKAFLGDDVPVSEMQSGGVSHQRSSQGEGRSSLALVPEYELSTVYSPESRPSFSRKDAQGLRMNDRHPGGDCNDAVVPLCGANTTSESLINTAKDKPLKGTLQKRGLPSKLSTSTTQPLPRSNLNSHQLTSKSGGPSDSSQVVPQTIPLACQQRRNSMVNKRGLTGGGDSNSNGPTPKRAKVEVDMKGDSSSGKGNAVIELEAGLPLKEWEEARRSQASRIRNKKTQVIKPIPGELISKKLQGPRLPLYELVHGQSPELYPESELLSCGVLPSTMTVTSSTAEDFKFKLKEHFTPDTLESSEGLRLGDGGRLVPDEAGTAGKQEFLNALLDTPGVDPKFLTSDWVNNHYRWVVWKLAAMEIAYPHYLSQRLLTPHQVLLQLKYRYDREIDHAQRSALKKILERDDTPSRRMVLCVAGIHRPATGAIAKSHQGTSGKENEKMPVSSTPVLLLTDGWYAVKTLIDKPLVGLVSACKIFVGLKLCIYGAELVGSQDACSPLEVPVNLMLRISANSTRRARYDALLGFQRYPQPFPISLTSLYPDGGMVGCVDVVVVRSYPMQYMEKQKEGGCIFRGRRAEDKEAARFAQEKQRQMEQLYSKVQNDYQENEKKTVKSNRRLMSTRKLTVSEVEKLHSGQEVYEALNNALDPGAVEALLSERQVNVLHDYQRSLHEKRQSDLQGEFKRAMEEQKQESHVERTVTPLLRLRVVDALRRCSAEECGTHQLTIWRPSDDVIQLLIEGKRFKIFNVSTSSGRFSVGSNNVQLASTRGTRYQTVLLQSPHSGDQAVYLQRESLRLTDTLRPDFTPAYGEVDVVGVIVLIQGAGNSPGKSTSQTVYLCDAQTNSIAIRFWGGLQAHCLDNLIKPGCFLAISNLQWRPNSGSSSIPCLHANDAVVVTTIPKATHLRLAMQYLQKTIKNPKAFAQSMEQSVKDRIATQSRFPTPQTPRSGVVQIPSATPCSAQGATPWAIHGVSPLADHGPNKYTITPHRTPVRGHSFGMEGGVFHAQNTTPGLPNSNQFPSWSGAHQGSLPRPHAASTPLHSLNTTPMRGRPTKHPLPSPYGQMPLTDPLEKSRLNISRRVDLLSRGPSPPPLSPLPTPPTNRVMSTFRAPSARTSLPQQGSSYRSRANSALRGQGAKFYPKPQAEDIQCEEVRCIDFDEQQSLRDTDLISPVGQATKPHQTGLDCSAIEEPGRKSSERSSEDMTPSQQQVLEVLGMSYKSLGEIDWEWTQEVDPHSEPSQDFSYDTPSQSSQAEEVLLDAKVLVTNSTKPKTEVGKIKEPVCDHRAPAVGEKPQKNGKEKRVESTSLRNRRCVSRRGRGGKRSKTIGPCSVQVKAAEEADIVDGRGDCLKNASQDPVIADTGVKENGDTELKMDNVGEGGDCVKTASQTSQEIKLSEVKVSSSDNASCKDTKEVAAKENKVDKRSENSWRKKELESRQGSTKCLENSDQAPRGVTASGQHSLESAPPVRKRKERSRVDLSILEQSILLGDESGEPTRRLTRSASQRTATKGGCKN